MFGRTGKERWSTWLWEKEWQEARICVPYDFYTTTIQKHVEIWEKRKINIWLSQSHQNSV